jgi:hypothetical protein
VVFGKELFRDCSVWSVSRTFEWPVEEGTGSFEWLPIAKQSSGSTSTTGPKDSEFLPFGCLPHEQEGLRVFSIATDFE